VHASVLDFLRSAVRQAELSGKEVLEVGSQNVNGSPREVLGPMSPKKYIGIDFQSGRDVDLVLLVEDLVTYFGLDCFDVVISTEMLEHAKDWRTAVEQMKAVLGPGGLLLVTTRAPGFPFHGFPHDYWRFRPEDFRKIFADMRIERLEPDPQPGHPGVFLKAWKTMNTPSVDLSKIDVPVVS
jgi:SAM-dependent methyltransferase